ncbi:MAG: hypothetical protein JXA97_10720 [Anaerolineales bacterium]|nr:hypothetical protein [Anaerolineales bacterium]
MNVWQKILIGILTLIIGMIIGVQINRVRLNRLNDALVADLLGAASTENLGVDEGLLVDLPVPVKRYLARAVPAGQPLAYAARLTQQGDFRLGDASSDFIPFSAVQYMTINPPGFVWDADMQMMPLMGVNVVDASVGGEGALRARLLSTLAVADAEPSEMLNEGELIRYLAEAVWFPAALLPGNGVTWEAVDDRSAIATLTHADLAVSLLFTFKDKDEVIQVYAEARGRNVEGEYVPTPWTGRFWHYQEMNGMLIPTEGEVEWNLADGDLVYWRGVIETAEYDLP